MLSGTVQVMMWAALGLAGESEPTVLLDFTASWCGPCREISPTVSRLEREGYPIRRVDVDREQQLSAQYRVTNIPTFIVLVQGREVARRVGKPSEAELRQLVAKLGVTPTTDLAPVTMSPMATGAANARTAVGSPAGMGRANALAAADHDAPLWVPPASQGKIAPPAAPALTVSPSTVPASTVPASTGPASTGPASPGPANTATPKLGDRSVDKSLDKPRDKSDPKSAVRSDPRSADQPADKSGDLSVDKTAVAGAKAKSAGSGFRLSVPFLSSGEKTPATTRNPGEPTVRANLDDASQAPQGEVGPVTDPLLASVRIRVRDAQGDDYGSGTIIDSRVGRTCILTCGHIFKQFQSKTSVIEVDVFAPVDPSRAKQAPPQTFVGKYILHDAEADVGLISIPTDTPLPRASLLPAGSKLVRDLPVVSVGCGGGDRPKLETHRITTLRRYRGPDNLECTGVPVLGRSGGGLFTRDGVLIGVCMAADREEQKGIYAGPVAIQDLLTRCQLTHLFRPATGVDLAVSPLRDVPASSKQATLAASGPATRNVATPSAGVGTAAMGRTGAVSEDQELLGTGAILGERTAADGSVNSLSRGTTATAHDLQREVGQNAASGMPRVGPGRSATPAVQTAGLASMLSQQEGEAPVESEEDVRGLLEKLGPAEIVCVIHPIHQPRSSARVVVLNRASPRFISYLTHELEAQYGVRSTSLPAGTVPQDVSELPRDLPRDLQRDLPRDRSSTAAEGRSMNRSMANSPEGAELAERANLAERAERWNRPAVMNITGTTGAARPLGNGLVAGGPRSAERVSDPSLRSGLHPLAAMRPITMDDESASAGQTSTTVTARRDYSHAESGEYVPPTGPRAYRRVRLTPASAN